MVNDELRYWRSRVRRNSYNFKLKETKKNVNSHLINNGKGDTKQLYQHSTSTLEFRKKMATKSCEMDIMPTKVLK